MTRPSTYRGPDDPEPTGTDEVDREARARRAEAIAHAQAQSQVRAAQDGDQPWYEWPAEPAAGTGSAARTVTDPAATDPGGSPVDWEGPASHAAGARAGTDGSVPDPWGAYTATDQPTTTANLASSDPSATFQEPMTLQGSSATAYQEPATFQDAGATTAEPMTLHQAGATTAESMTFHEAGATTADPPMRFQDTSVRPGPAVDDPSQVGADIDALLSDDDTGEPIHPGGTGADSQAFEITVDGKVVSSGDGGVEIDLDSEGGLDVVPDEENEDSDWFTEQMTANRGGGQSRSGQGGGGAGSPMPRGQGRDGSGEDSAANGEDGTGGTAGGEDGTVIGPDDGTDDGWFVHGDGDNPANVELTVDSEGLGDVPIEVVKNPDGSLDVHLIEADADGHDVNIHIAPGEDADINIRRGADGQLEIHAGPDAAGDNKTGENPPDMRPPAVVRHPDDPPFTPAPADETDDKPGTGDDSADSGLPEPSGGGGADTGGGGGGPSGGGGGPSGGGGPQRKPLGSDNGGGREERKWDPDAIRKLGKDLDEGPGSHLDTANHNIGSISIWYPSFGVLGIGLNFAHNAVRDRAQSYVREGRSKVGQWNRGLDSTATNYEEAEKASTTTDY